jgi:putative membrane protein
LNQHPAETPPWLPSLHVGKQLVGWMAVALAYTLAVALLVSAFELSGWAAGKEVVAVLGLMLGILLVFRTNSAYKRWWEARTQWGQLINETRNLILKAHAHTTAGPEEQQHLARFLIGFAHALRLHLRGQRGVQAVPGFEQEPTSFPHAPGYLAGRVHQLLDHWNRQGKLHDTVWILDRHAGALMDVCGACERILSTPLTSSYRALVRGGIALYVLLTPWSVLLQMGWWGLFVLVVGFTFMLGMELTAEVVEEPFGREADDLPLETYCQTIETFVLAVLKETQLASNDERSE